MVKFLLGLGLGFILLGLGVFIFHPRNGTGIIEVFSCSGIEGIIAIDSTGRWQAVGNTTQTGYPVLDRESSLGFLHRVVSTVPHSQIIKIRVGECGDAE